MKLARARSQRLSDVVQATRSYLNSLQGQDLFAYLKALISKDVDYVRRVKDQMTEIELSRDKERLERKKCELIGRRLRDASGRIFDITPQGLACWADTGFVEVLNLQFLEALDAGRLMIIS